MKSPVFHFNVFHSILHFLCFFDEEFCSSYHMEQEELREYNMAQINFIQDIAAKHNISDEEACQVYSRQYAASFRYLYHLQNSSPVIP